LPRSNIRHLFVRSISIVVSLSVAACGRIGFRETPDASAAAKPLVWLPLDDVAGPILVDASGHGHDAVCTGASCPMLGVPGAVGTAALFDGADDYAKVAFAPDLEVPTITVSLWAKQISLPSGFGALASRQHGTSTDDRWILFYDQNATHDYSWAVGPTSGEVGPSGGPSSGDLGSWQYLVGTYDGAVARLYRNAVEVDEQTISRPLVTDITGIVIGAADNGNPLVTDFANAAIDDVRIYSKVLDDAAIDALYVEGGMTAHWTLDEATGSSFADSSGNGNTASCTACPRLGAQSSRGTAASFYNNAVIVAPDIGYGPGNQISVAAWVRYARANCAQECYVVAKQLANNGTPYNLEVTAAGAAELYVADLNTNATSSGIDVGDGAWHHLLGTFDGVSIALYVDGILRGTGTGIPTMVAGPVSIGSAASDPAYRPFTGDIDDVRIYPRALTAAQAAALYAASP